MKHTSPSRRKFLAGSAVIAGSLFAPIRTRPRQRVVEPRGQIIGEATAERVGAEMFAAGGNAIDAVVAGALAAAVAAPHQTGIGGYGMSAVVAGDNGRKILAFDGNSAAPAALTRDFFRPGADGIVPGRVNERGWLSAGVPGVLAGLRLVRREFGTKSFSELVQPAIRLARDGFPWPASLVGVVAGNPQFEKDDGSKKLYLRNGSPPVAGELFHNPELAELLTTLADQDSVEAFYRGDIAQRIADVFQKNGGLVTAADMAAYQARIVAPLILKWDDKLIHTAPLTAGGLSILQMLQCLKALDWSSMPEGFPRTQARIEAMRLAWSDRLTLLGDPDHGNVPVAKLLSDAYARESADRIQAAVSSRTILKHSVRTTGAGGTIHLSAADRDGNFVALTLTHGAAFGSCVTVDGLGLTLGHGMSRFDPNPEHPNSPGPGKRPLHNMVPTIVTDGAVPILAAGGAGGRKIPNSLFDVLTEFVIRGKSLRDAIKAQRVHTEGDPGIVVEQSWPAPSVDKLKTIGYSVTRSAGASISAVGRENGELIRLRR